LGERVSWVERAVREEDRGGEEGVRKGKGPEVQGGQLKKIQWVKTYSTPFLGNENRIITANKIEREESGDVGERDIWAVRGGERIGRSMKASREGLARRKWGRREREGWQKG